MKYVAVTETQQAFTAMVCTGLMKYVVMAETQHKCSLPWYKLYLKDDINNETQQAFTAYRMVEAVGTSSIAVERMEIVIPSKNICKIAFVDERLY